MSVKDYSETELYEMWKKAESGSIRAMVISRFFKLKTGKYCEDADTDSNGDLLV